MQITFQGKAVTLTSSPLKVKDEMPSIVLVKNDLSEFCTSDIKGKKVFLSVPSLDTNVCSLEVETFMNYIKASDDVTCFSVSMDLPFALDRWCQAKENEHVVTTSDYKYRSFGEACGLMIKEIGLLTRAVFVVDSNNIIQYVEVVPEITNEPNYDAVLNALADIK